MKLEYFRYDDRGQEKRLAYWSSGDPSKSQTLVCVHGLLRHSRDFDEIAQASKDQFFVICPDLPGRGLSDPLSRAEDYHPQYYAQVLSALLAHLNRAKISWIGTSLGGLIGMLLSAAPESLIDKLVLNDIGAELPLKGLQRIANYAQPPEFNTRIAVEDYLRQTYTSYKELTNQQWERLAAYGSRPLETGGYALHYDPLIALNTRAGARETIELWPLWQMISQPCLLIHGLESDLLTKDIVKRMRDTHPDMELMPLEGIGHAPALMLDDQIQPVINFITRGIA